MYGSAPLGATLKRASSGGNPASHTISSIPKKSRGHGLAATLLHGLQRGAIDTAAGAAGGIAGGLQSIATGAVFGPNLGPGIAGRAAVRNVPAGMMAGVAFGEALNYGVDTLTGYSSKTAAHGTFRGTQMPHRTTKKKSSRPRRIRAAGNRPGYARMYQAVKISELKHFETGFLTWSAAGGNEPNTSWQTLAVPCLPVQGTDFNQRIGRRIRIVKIEIRCEVETVDPAQLSGNGDEFWMELFKDKLTRGTLAGPTDIYNSPGANVMGFKNPSNARRFKLLASHKHNVHATTRDGVNETAEVEPKTHVYTLPIKYDMEFTSAGTPVQADVLSNSIVAAVCNANASLACIYHLNARFWFQDL